MSNLNVKDAVIKFFAENPKGEAEVYIGNETKSMVFKDAIIVQCPDITFVRVLWCCI